MHSAPEGITFDRRQEFRALLEWVAGLPRPSLDYTRLTASAFLRVEFCCRLLIHQASYMILCRTFGTLYRRGLIPDVLLRPEGLTPAGVVEWSAGLTARTSYEAFCVYPDRQLFAFAAYLRREADCLGDDWERRLKDKPLTREFIRLDWEGEDRTVQIERLLKVDTMKGHDPVEAEGWRKGARAGQSRGDIQTTAWMKALELWREPDATGTMPEALPEFPLGPDAMLPDERAFWDGPMARAWTLGLGAILREMRPIFTGERESMPEKVRDQRREGKRTSKRRKTILAGQDNFPDDPHGRTRAEWDLAQSARRSRQEDIGRETHSGKPPGPLARLEADDLYQELERHFGEPLRLYAETLITGGTNEEAAEAAGVGSEMGRKYRHKLKKFLSRKKVHA